MEIFNTAPLSLPRLPDKARVTLLALGDVGSTLLMGLRLLGGDVISSLGICDVRENVASRWEFELDQIAPPEGGPLPEADVIAPEQLFDGDVFLFCASRMIPDTSVVQGDVRMAQYALNRELVGHYARMAREKQYRGLFVVVSDPVDPLCRWALRESNKNECGDYDGLGLSPEQIRGFGLGVMHARALYFARRDPRLASYLTEGRAFVSRLRHRAGIVRRETRREGCVRDKQKAQKPTIAPGSGFQPPHYRLERKKNNRQPACPEREAGKGVRRRGQTACCLPSRHSLNGACFCAVKSCSYCARSTRAGEDSRGERHADGFGATFCHQKVAMPRGRRPRLYYFLRPKSTKCPAVEDRG